MNNDMMKFTLLLGSFILSSWLAVSQELKVICPPEAPKPIGPYSHALMKNNLLFVSGQIAIDPVTGEADTLTIENEIHRVMKNLFAILTEAGLDWSNIMKTTIYTTDLKNFSTINKIYSSYLKEPYPARETVQVAALPKNMHVEISVIALK
jgi:2-iminobutanoate/2-iminopropanoate deaminase